jgi:acyl-CoA synthetase (NDP forming)
VLVGVGGGASVLFTDTFEKHGLKLPRVPDKIVAELRGFTSAAGNILSNPVDYSQAMMFPDKVKKAVDILLRWDGSDIMVKFMRSGQWAKPSNIWDNPAMYGGFLREGNSNIKPIAIIIEPSIEPQESGPIYTVIQEFAKARVPVYLTFESAAIALDLVLKHYGK